MIINYFLYPQFNIMFLIIIIIVILAIIQEYGY